MRIYKIDFQRRIFAHAKASDQQFEMMIVIEEPITDTISDPMTEFTNAVEKFGWEFTKILSGPTLVFDGIVFLQKL